WIRSLSNHLRAGDLLVVNNTRVFPARLLGHRVPSGGAVECLLVGRAVPVSGASVEGQARESDSEVGLTSGAPKSDFEVGLAGRGQLWETLMHPGQKLKPGARVVFEGDRTLQAEVLERRFFGRRLIRLWTDDGSDIDAAIDAIGHIPLPPYIKRPDDDADR